MIGLWVLTRKEVLEQRRTWKFLAMVGIFTAVALLVGIVPYIVTEVQGEEFSESASLDLLQGFSFTIIGLGTLLSIIVSMGSLANERANGTAAMTLSKPVTRAAFVASKFLGMVVSIYAALAVSSAVMYILTLILAGDGGHLGGFTVLMAVIGVYMVFIGSIAFFLSALFTRQLLAGGLALLLFIVQQPLLVIPHTERYWPISASTWGLSFLQEGDNEAWPAFAIALGCIAILSIGAWAVFRRKEL